MRMDSLRSEIFSGDFAALQALAKYLESKKAVTEFLGHHLLKTEERHIATRYIKESCYFKDLLSPGKDSITREIFERFLASNKIIFNEGTGYFTPGDYKPDSTKYVLYTVDSPALDSIKQEFSQSLPSILTESGADWSYRLRNPQCLLLLAEYFLKQRTKWNIYHFNDDVYVKSFRYFTHMDVAVPDEDSSLNFTYRMTSEGKRQNLYSYFYYHYNDYQWNDSLGYFVNKKEDAGKKSDLLTLFERLQSKDDSVALSAFAQICEANPVQVTELSKQYKIYDYDDNFSLPTFTYKFLPVIADLTAYWRLNQIAYKPSSPLKEFLEQLATTNGFRERYTLENTLIAKTTIDEINAIEYFGLLNENNFQNTYSLGRVLDKWYSKNWNAVVSDKKHLEAFLKKAIKFQQLGIIGICNKYLLKFRNNPIQVLDKVKEVLVSCEDNDVKMAANMVIQIIKTPFKSSLPPINEWAGEKAYNIINPVTEIQKILISGISKEDKENKIEVLTGKINYSQIGVVLKKLASDTSLDDYSKFNFLESDFGLYLPDHNKRNIDSFLKKYNSLSEKELYLSNLTELGIPVKGNAGEYDYRAIHEILKYDVVDEFVGGGGGRRDYNVYQVIKLLELRFGTTLGFINKLCSWQGTWGCNCTDRAKYWLDYLNTRNLIDVNIAEPPSISSKN